MHNNDMRNGSLSKTRLSFYEERNGQDKLSNYYSRRCFTVPPELEASTERNLAVPEPVTKTSKSPQTKRSETFKRSSTLNIY